MCRKVTCSTCRKATWSGCGQHVEEALAGVPASDRCRCASGDAGSKGTTASTGTTTISTGTSGWSSAAGSTDAAGPQRTGGVRGLLSRIFGR